MIIFILPKMSRFSLPDYENLSTIEYSFSEFQNNIIDKILTESSHFYATKIAGDLSDKVEITPTIVANSDGSSFNVTYEMPKGYKYFYLKGYLYNSGLANDDATRWPLDIYRIYIYGYE